MGGAGALTPGKHTLEFDFKYDGPGMAKGGTGVLRVDGKEVASHSLAHTIPASLTFDETFDIGSDTRTPVDDADYQVPFPFTGTIDKVDFKLGPAAAAVGQQGRARHEDQRGPAKRKKTPRPSLDDGPERPRLEPEGGASAAHQINDEIPMKLAPRREQKRNV